MSYEELGSLDGVSGLTDLVLRLAWGRDAQQVPHGQRDALAWACGHLSSALISESRDPHPWVLAYRLGTIFATYVHFPLRIITTGAFGSGPARPTDFAFLCGNRCLRMVPPRRSFGPPRSRMREPKLEWSLSSLKWIPSRLVDAYSISEGSAIEATVIASHACRSAFEMEGGSFGSFGPFRAVMETISTALRAPLRVQHGWRPLYYFDDVRHDATERAGESHSDAGEREVLAYESVADRWMLGHFQDARSHEVPRDPGRRRPDVGRTRRGDGDARGHDAGGAQPEEPAGSGRNTAVDKDPLTAKQVADLIIMITKDELPREWSVRELVARTSATKPLVLEALGLLVQQRRAQTAKRDEGTWYKLEGGADVLVSTFAATRDP